MADRGWIHRTWSRVGWPPSYWGKLVLGAAICLLPWALATVVAPEVAGAAAICSAIFLLLFLFAMTRPLRRAADDLLSTLGTVEHEELADRRRDAVDFLATYAAREEARERGRRTALGRGPTADFPTALPNRTEALERLRQSRSLAYRDHLPLTVALMEVEYVGEASPDDDGSSATVVVGAVGQRLAQLLRGSDWGARWSEDSFLLALFSATNGARVALERLLHDLSSMTVVTEGRRYHCVVTLGAAHVHPEDSVRDCVERAAAQLEKARREGGGDVVVAD